VVLAHVLLPERFGPYIVGAIAASCGWWIYVLMLELGGMARLRAGVTAEEWTSSALRGLHSKGWRTANHIRIEFGDVDHAALGPAGFFAIETKFRSDWSRADLMNMARQAQLCADRLRPRLGEKATTRPLVVMWGPKVGDFFPQPVERDGVTFCRGHLVAEHLLGLPVVTEQPAIDKAYERLEKIVRSRDSREVADEGEFVRPFVHGVVDVVVVAVAFFITTVGLLAPASLTPEGWWTVVASVVVAGLMVVVRRRSHHPRVRHAAVAIWATAVGLGLIMLMTITFELLA